MIVHLNWTNGVPFDIFFNTQYIATSEKFFFRDIWIHNHIQINLFKHWDILENKVFEKNQTDFKQFSQWNKK